MPKALGSEDFDILQEHVDAGDRIAYYAQLDEWGYRYGALAGSVVTNDSLPGATANIYFAQEYLEDTGSSFDFDDLASLSLDLMREDLKARRSSAEVSIGKDLHVDAIEEYHSRVFASYGAEADSWTPYIALQQLETPEERQTFWDGMLDAGTIGGNLASYYASLEEVWFGIIDPDYALDISLAGGLAATAPSTDYGPYSVAIGNGGYALGGNYQDNSVNGSVGNDVLMGFDGYDTLAGGAGEDRIYGGADDDILVGGSVDEDGNYIDDNSSDTLIGGAGHDTYHITLDWDIAGDFESDFTVWSLSYDDYHANNDAEFTLNTDVINHIDFIGDMDMDGEVVIHTGTAFAPSFSLQTINLRSGQYGFVDWDYEFEVNGYSWAATWVTNGTGRDLVIHDREIQALNGFVVNAYFAIHEADLQSSGFRTHAGSIDAGENGGLAEGDGDNNLITGSVGDDTAIGKGGSDTYLDLGKSGTDVVTDVGSASDVDRVDLTSQSFADTIFARGGAPTVNSQTALIDAASTTYQPGTNDLVITGIAGSSLAGTLIIRDYFGGPETGIEQIALSDRLLSLQDVLAILNTAPTVDEPIVDQTATEGQEWSFTIPATSFSDADGDALTYSATLADGSPLPDWLSFDAATRTFTGTPPQGFDGNLSLSVTVHDGIAGVADTFELTINDTPFTGTAGDDVLHGDGNANVLSGLGGNDAIHGYGGDDTLIGGAGADSLLGGDGNDTVYADADDTWFSGDAGIDTLIYQGTDDRQYAMDQGAFENMQAGAGNNTVWGTAANNVIDGQAGNDVIHGYGGDDTLIGGAGTDSLLGGDGNDTVYADADDTWFSGDAGIDTLIYTGADNRQYSLAQGAFENAHMGSGNNVVWGTDAANTIDGQAGNDTLFGYGGSDRIIGGAGSDYLVGGAGNDTFVFALGDTGHDTVADFGAGDVIEFDSSLFGTFADVLASASDDGVNTYISIDADTSIRLDNILVGQLQMDDFHFV